MGPMMLSFGVIGGISALGNYPMVSLLTHFCNALRHSICLQTVVNYMCRYDTNWQPG